MNRLTKVASVVIASSLLFACAGISPKASFYTLKTADNTQVPISANQDATAQEALRIQLMPISIDETVDRPQIVITKTNNQVQYLEQQRWAQPLKYEIGRVLGEHLHQQFASSIVSAYPHQLSHAAIQVNVQVTAFESFYDREATIKINYTVLNTQTKQSISLAKIYTQPLTSGEVGQVNAIIDAQSLNLLQLSRDIATNINAIN